MLTSILLLFALVQLPAKETLPGATHVTRVDATLMCGGATTPEAFPELRKRGFTSIINLRRESESGADIPGAENAARAAGLRFVHVPVDGANPTAAAADAFIAAVTDPANHPMYVHCGTANRVAAMWLIKRVVVDGWDVQRATEEAEAIGLTHRGLRKFAVDYATARKR